MSPSLPRQEYARKARAKLSPPNKLRLQSWVGIKGVRREKVWSWAEGLPAGLAQSAGPSKSWGRATKNALPRFSLFCSQTKRFPSFSPSCMQLALCVRASATLQRGERRGPKQKIMGAPHFLLFSLFHERISRIGSF